jgi:LPS export ABC transporter protein LptC
MRSIRLLLVVALIAVFGLSCSKEKAFDERGYQEDTDALLSSSDELDSEEAGQRIMTFSVSGTERGKIRWNIEGESADIISPDIIKLQNVKGKNYLENNVINITADEGELDRVTNNVILSSNVLVETEDGIILKTERLNWNATGEYIWTEDFVEVVKDNIEIEGYSASGYPSLDQVKLERDVKIDIKPSTMITCDGPLEVDYHKKIAFLNSNVVITDEKGLLLSDKAEVYFDEKGEKIHKVVALGNVEIKRNGDASFSKRAIYLVDERKIILTGQPKLLVYSK